MNASFTYGIIAFFNINNKNNMKKNIYTQTKTIQSARSFSILFFLFSVSAFNLTGADTELYGKINLDLLSTEVNSKSSSETNSNASRLGYKAKFKLSNKVNFLLQIENEIDVTDGKANKNKVLKQRNTFIGISGDFGKLFVGTHDTAFKKSQLKVDLFNDTKSDIKNLFAGENRSQDLVGYTSPEIIEGLKVTLNNIKTSSKSYQSYSFDYNANNFKSSFGIDSGLKGYESKRFAILKPINNSTFGFLYQESINVETSNKESGYVVSLKHKLSSRSSLMFQTSESDIKLIGGKQNAVGYSYQYNSILKLFTSYSKRSQSDSLKNKKMISVGFELKF